MVSTACRTRFSSSVPPDPTLYQVKEKKKKSAEQISLTDEARENNNK